jgi:hypothetical protein
MRNRAYVSSTIIRNRTKFPRFHERVVCGLFFMLASSELAARALVGYRRDIYNDSVCQYSLVSHKAGTHRLSYEA